MKNASTPPRYQVLPRRLNTHELLWPYTANFEQANGVSVHRQYHINNLVLDKTLALTGTQEDADRGDACGSLAPSRSYYPRLEPNVKH